MGYDNFLEDQYKVPILAKILHSLPHLNITFHRTNNTFRPTDEIYLEVRHVENRLTLEWNLNFPYRRVWEFWDQFRQLPLSSPSSASCSTWCRDAAIASRAPRTQSLAWKLHCLSWLFFVVPQSGWVSSKIPLKQFRKSRKVSYTLAHIFACAQTS